MTAIGTLSDALAICTRNRIDDIKRCLTSVESASYVPQRIIVIDSSDGDETEEHCKQSSLAITYIRAQRGLTIQRNVALAEIHEDIVHFIDDDVEVEPDYFREILRTFQDTPQAAGAGGATLGARPGRPILVARLALNGSVHPGRVLRSGYNTGCYDWPTAMSVDWLPGCSMSFRMSAIRGLKFDERRKGYGLGEDVDFGLKALERGPLLYTPSARLVHHVSPTNRAELPIKVRAAVHNRWALALDFPHRVNRFLVIYASLAEGLIIGAKSLKRGRAVRRRMAIAAFAGVIDVLKDGSNVDL